MKVRVDAPPKLDTEAIRWDAEAEAFVRLTLDPCGKILARRDLEPVEKRAALRRLIGTRTTLTQRRAIGRLMQPAGLLLQERSLVATDSPEDLGRRFFATATVPDIVALVKNLKVEMRTFLVLAYGIALARAAPGQPLPPLEDIDPNLPYLPPAGPPTSEGFIDAEAILAEVDGVDIGGTFELYIK